MMRLDFLICGLTAQATTPPDCISGDTAFIYDLIKALKLPCRTKLQRKALYPDRYDYNMECVGRQDLSFFTCNHIWKWNSMDINEAIGGLLIMKGHKWSGHRGYTEDDFREFIQYIIDNEVDFLITG